MSEFDDLGKYPYWAYDTETTGLQYLKDKVFGFSVSTPDGIDRYFDIREEPMAVSWINDMARNAKCPIIMHNASFDIRMSDFVGIEIPLERAVDTVIRACCINEHLHAYNLGALGREYLGMDKDTQIYEDLKKLFGGRATKNVQMPRIHMAPVGLVSRYAKQDTRVTLKLYEWQEDEIAMQGIEDIVAFELDKMPTFIRAEMRGIRVDLDYTEQAMRKMTPLITRKQNKLNKIAGMAVNVNSSPQIKQMFAPIETGDGWETKDGHPVGTTPNGGPSINAEILRTMESPESKLILELRSMLKMRDTFLGKHVLEHNINGRVYPSINQSKTDDGLGTGTGRLSYTDPAMQQIPNRDKKQAAIIKPCFLPDEGMVWCDTDMASFEVRVFAHLVNNPLLTAEYSANPHMDFHQYVADLTGLVRQALYGGQPNAKQLNLSMIFNSGEGAIAEKMGLDWTWAEFVARNGERVRYKKPGIDAVRIIEEYHLRIPGIKKLIKGCKDTALKYGHVFTSVGRRLRFPDPRYVYKASGLLIQATAGDINKENWKIVEDVLDGEGHMILNTHDSYSLSLPEDWKPHYERVKGAIERDRLRVPLILDWNGTGRNWHQALQGIDNAFD